MPIQKIEASFSKDHSSFTLNEGETNSLTMNSIQLQLLGNNEGKGKLYLTSQRVVWINNSTSNGYSFDYPFICLHAICKDLATYPMPCIYCQLESGFEVNEDKYAHPENIPEMRFIPENPDNLEVIFRVLSEMSALNTDPENEDESEDEYNSIDDEMDINYDIEQNGDYWVPPMTNNGEMDDIPNPSNN